MDVIFAISVCVILYTYIIYPFIITVWGTMARRPVQRDEQPIPLSVVLAVRNEESAIEERIENLIAQDYPRDMVEIIIVSDGSDDATIELAAGYQHERVIVIDTGEPVGKAQAINRGVESASGELIVFADARQRFAPDVLSELAAMFHDESVGCVSGELVISGNGGSEMREGMGLYWSYEKWIRRMESKTDSVVGASGSIYAVRRSLYTPLPPGTILDDFLLPMRIVLRGYRTVFTRKARAFDTVSSTSSHEFWRKTRTLAGNYQALRLEPALLNPARNRLWFQLLSHKLARLLVPYFCILAFASNLYLTDGIMLALLLLQVLFYGAGLLRWTPLADTPLGFFIRVSWTFMMLNAAAVAGLWVFITGGETTVWKR